MNNPFQTQFQQPTVAPATYQNVARSQLHVEFYDKPVLDKKASKAQGRPIHKTVEYVLIKFPGDKLRIVDAPAHERTMMHPEVPGVRLNFIERFPQHYAIFKQEQHNKVVGTPLDIAPFLSAAQVADLKAQNVHTIEQLSEVPDRALPHLGMGSRNWRDKARDYIATSQRQMDVAAVSTENAEMRDRIAQLEAMLAQLGAGAVAPASSPVDGSGDDDEDLGPGADFESWSTDALKAFLADAGVDVNKHWGKPILINKARDLVRERRKADD